MDSFIYGATSYGDFNCDMSPKYVDFVNHETKFSQITFTEAAVECMLNSMAHSEILDLKLNQQQMNALFNRTDIKLSTDALANQMPIFKEKLGAGKKLRVELGFSDFIVKFGKMGHNVTLDYLLKISFNLDLPAKFGGKELIYDEIHMTTGFDVEADDDVLFGNIKYHKIKPEHTKTHKGSPVRDGMKLT